MNDERTIPCQRIDLLVNISEMDRLTAFVRSLIEQAGMSLELGNKLRLIIEEAVANVITYSGATAMSLTVWQHDGCLSVAVEDDGQPFDPLTYDPADVNVPIEQRKMGGLGILYIRQMSDHVAYRREGEKNILTMTKKL